MNTLIQRVRAHVDGLRPERAFLVISLLAGLTLTLINPPFQAPDECDHYTRAFQLSEGTVLGERRGDTAGGELPNAAIDVTNTEGIPFHYERKMTASLFQKLAHPIFMNWRGAPRGYRVFPHTVVYSPVGYLPQVTALVVGRSLGVGPLGLMYLARLAGFAASVALGYAALKCTPVYRWTMLAILLCPMSLYLFGSIAPDGLLITAAFLLVARLLRLQLEGISSIGWSEAVVDVALAAFVSNAKPVYLPLACLACYVLLPRVRSPRGKMALSAALLLGCLGLVVLWNWKSAFLFVPGKGAIPIDAGAQARHIVEAPLEFLCLVIRTIRVQYAFNYRWMIGTLGWGDTPMPEWFYGTFGIGIMASLIVESGEGVKVSWATRGTMLIAAGAAGVLIYAAQYANWNPPLSTDPIEGIEGRYFLPLMPLIICSFPATKLRTPPWLPGLLGGFLGVLASVVCLSALVLRYYVP
jgi:uncharacterized membrane protein